MSNHVFSAKEFVQVLSANGYTYVRSKGSHSIYKNEKTTIVITKNLNPMVCRRIIKENRLSIK